MKSILILLSIITQLSHGNILEIDSNQKIIYAHPSPQMEATIVELDQSSGVLFLSMDYESEKTLQQLEILQTKYPDYEIKVIPAQTNGQVSLELSQILKTEFKMMQGQVGPLINMTLGLDSTQIKKLKLKQNDLQSLVQIQVPVRFQFLKNQVIESYSVEKEFCRSLNVKNVRDLIMAFSKLTQPKEIKFDQTFANFKEQLLAKCFRVADSPVSSFKELLDIQVGLENQESKIEGIYSKRVEKSISTVITPNTKISFR